MVAIKNLPKFYDVLFASLYISLILLVLLVFGVSDLISDILALVIVICLIFLSLSILYNQFKNKHWYWFSINIITSIFGGGIIITPLYYFMIMRKNLMG